ncbi:hypothetical protein [Chryseobacterium daecheongense]|uniref:Uncharacterized protein n=1 Tax=Chryseobacterium daecheongense TaxID=192389 RepID=A0A3N0VSY9_9FLAO|nr:hypothetical protein [Chryseobacterium daecheongense]ROH95937.1 hypothetical protein EGI05_15580 [Chryseobacterium daecheongense]TDX91663.1 hypothetical protein BCF50_2801 [Chryseobacterium daecheongense]
MKRNYLLYIVLLFIANFINAQTITFISENTNKPLPKVSVFGKDGSILAYSDIDGKIDRQALAPSQEKFQLVYDNYPIATLSYSDFDKEIIKIDDKVKEIEAVVIKNNKPAKYVFVKGNFNTYVTLNNKLNCYADGVVTYIFDNKSKKLKSTHIEQYRIFRLENVNMDRKQLSSWDYGTFLEVPKIKNVGNVEEYKTKNTRFKELKGNRKDEVEITGEALQKKEFALFGYRFFDFRSILNIAYEKDSKKTLKDLLEYNEIEFLKLKHKSEPEYNAVVVYSNFYPTELDFGNNNDIEKIKFSANNSNYQNNFWEDSSFPNMQTVFSSYFKDDLKEKQNSRTAAVK